MHNPSSKPPSEYPHAATADLTDWLAQLRPVALDFMALAAGALLPFAFAPFELFPLAIIAPAFLFALWLHGSPARAAARGFLFGLGTFGVGTSWVYVSLHNYGNMPAILAAFIVLVFTAALATFPAIVGWLQARLHGRGQAAHLLLLVPALWVLLEWARGWFLTGFPWLNLGYSQVPSALAGFAPWLGVYGVSAAAAASAALLVQLLRDRTRLWRYYLPALLLAWALGWLAGSVAWTQPLGVPLRVALVQGNVPIVIKWQPRHRQAILQRYADLSAKARDSDLIVWPEAAMPTYLDELDPEFLALLQRRAVNDGTDFLIGVVERDPAQPAFYNSAVSIGSASAVYRKQHLVPLGEFLPLKSVLGWLIDYYHIPMSDFSAGASDQPPLPVAGQKIAVTICYEDAFGQELIRQLPAASLLVNISEEAWFGDSLAPHQRLQMAQMRALETGRFMLRAANTGPSAVIDVRGRISARSPQFEPFVLSAQAQPMQGATPYIRFGNYPVISGIVILFTLRWWRRGRTH